ncbi:MAG: hypothetical protein RLZZ89_1519 [Cyanobacteriota bacterium]|jgi:signal peptidase I
MAESKPQKSAWSQVFSFFLVAALALLLRWAVLEPRWIPSGSMLPSLELQDRILVEKLSQRFKRLPTRGEIVVFRVPEPLLNSGYDPKAALIKRVVGIPGDQLEVIDGRLKRNGEYANEPWLAEPMSYNMKSIEVLPGQLWVLGDNRNASLDSHIWGGMPQQNLIGTAIWRYWPLARFGAIKAKAS